MAGSSDLFDDTAYTSSTEYDSRYGTKIDTLQIHHATMTSINGLIDMMMPGGRQVSANGAMSNTGYLYEVVPLAMRAFTSATVYDRRCLTVECCNLTLGPDWLISDASRERFARLAVAMYRAGMLGGLNRQYIIGHNEVPGTYATACPGPDMNLDWIVARAIQINAGSGTEGESEMIRSMIRRLDETTSGKIQIAFYDDSHWQECEIKETATDAYTLSVRGAYFGTNPVSYNGDIWNVRSNLTPTLRKPLYTQDPKTKALVPIVEGGSTVPGTPGAPTDLTPVLDGQRVLADQITKVATAIAGVPTAVLNMEAERLKS